MLSAATEVEESGLISAAGVRPLAVVALGLLAAAVSPIHAQDFDEPSAAALRLKQAKVTRQYEECLTLGATDAFCRAAITSTGEQEKRATLRLMALVAELPMNEERLSAEYLACVNPALDYSGSVWCVEQLVDRLEAAKAGQFLTRR